LFSFFEQFYCSNPIEKINKKNLRFFLALGLLEQ